MISPSDDADAELTALEKYLDELDRKVYSTFAVTNPATGVKHLEAGRVGSGYQVRLRDDHGNVIFGNDPVNGLTGLRVPMPMYPETPLSGQLYGTTTTWVTMWQMTTFMNSTNVQIAYRCQDILPSGGTSEYRVAFDYGAGLTVMAGSLASGVNKPHTAVGFFSNTWPVDVFDTPVTIYFQGRMASGTGRAVLSPIAILGG